ncbi:MAG: hypothetical protein SGARI_000935 [Bacillariaceae sp.]
MKFEAISMVTFLAAVSVPPETQAYNMYSAGPRRNNCRPPSSFNRDSFSGSPRRRDRVEEAFRQLENEMNGGPRRGRKSGQFDFMMMDPTTLNFEEIDQEAVKKWVNKAFELASEFNQDFSKNDQERQTNDEVLQKSREWVENMYTTDEEGVDTSSPSAEATEGTVDTAASKNQNPNEPEQPSEPEVITPYSENRSDDEMFMVAVDLPGVERSDVDLTLENDFLVVEAERRFEDEGESSAPRKYVKKFAVIEDEIEVEEIAAALESGVLTISAPKKKREETKIKIPLA